MDPNEYALAYDQNISRTLANNYAFNKIRRAILGRCLHFGKGQMSQHEQKCIEREYEVLKKYLQNSKGLKMQYQDSLCSALDMIKVSMFVPKFRYTVCTQHPAEQASLVCLDIDCEKARVICPQCQLLNHRLHQTRPIRFALQEIWLDVRKDIPVSIVAKIDQLQLKFQGIINGLGEDKNIIQPQFLIFFALIHQNIRRYLALSHQILNCVNIDSQFNSLIKRYKFYDRNQQSEGKSNFELYLENMVDHLVERLNDFQNDVTQRAGIEKILKIFSPIHQNSPLHYTFSPNNHHYSIALTQDLLTATQKNSNSTHLSFIEPAIVKKAKLKSKKTIKFFINKHGSWLSLGVAYLKSAKDKAFNFASGSSGHGAFMACHNGYIWHHSDPSLNSGYCSFNYRQGDTVTISVIPPDKLLFEREGCQPHEMYFDLLPHQQLFFCVALSSHQQSVSIAR